jgi:hypothetical protein
MANDRARAKTIILRWFDEGYNDPPMRRKLSAGIDRFFDEIAKRELWSECITTLLGNSSAPKIVAWGRSWRATPSRRGLAVSSVVPGWGYGWTTIFTDQYVYDILSWLGHFARQYVHRSNVAKVLMIAWEQHQAILHPFGSQGNWRRYGGFFPPVKIKVALDVACAEIHREWGRVKSPPPPTWSRWTRRNTLDPAIHQGISHFLRGQRLASAGFDLEALVAFDCVIQSLQTMDWSLLPGDPRHVRADLLNGLGFKAPTVHLAEHIYFLRNHFIAHAGGWRWWDAGEDVDEEFMAKASRFALRALRIAADRESLIRKIDPAPSNWGDWFLSNFPTLWDAIWFRDPKR